MSNPHYTMIIQWSEEDQIFVVSLPEWGPYCKTHGSTYEEAAKMGTEVLEMLLETGDAQKNRIPTPKLFHSPGADVIDLPCDGAVADVPVMAQH